MSFKVISIEEVCLPSWKSVLLFGIILAVKCSYVNQNQQNKTKQNKSKKQTKNPKQTKTKNPNKQKQNHLSFLK